MGEEKKVVLSVDVINRILEYLNGIKPETVLERGQLINVIKQSCRNFDDELRKYQEAQAVQSGDTAKESSS